MPFRLVLGNLVPSHFVGETIEIYYYGSLVHEDLHGRQHTMKTYGEHILAVNRSTFNKCVNKLPATAIDRTHGEHLVWIGPEPFCVIKYINEAVCQNNMEFNQMRPPDSPSDSQLPRILAIRTLRNVEYTVRSFLSAIVVRTIFESN